MSNNIKILLVEDNPGDVRLIQEMLKETDIRFNLECVDTLSKGMEHLSKGAVDVVLLDLGLPDSQGLDTLVKINTSCPHIPIVIITGLHDGIIGNKSIQKGAQDYLVKGQIDSNILERTLRYAIERKKMEGRIKHLNAVLRAIRKVNQLIIREKDRNVILQKSCDILIKTRGYDAAWLGFLRDNKTFAKVRGSGFREDISRFCEHVMRGDHPPCIKSILAQKESFVIVDKSRECGDCFFKSGCMDKEVAIIRVEYAGRLFGLLAISLASDVIIDKEEKGLLEEVADDIAFAFYSMKLEEERKEAEHQKEKAKREAEFYGDVLAHDIGNLDQITMGYLYLLRTAKDEEARKKNINGIKKSIMKSKRLAESIKILKIIKDTKIEKFDLNKSIERSIENIKEYSDKEIEVKLHIDKKYYVKANDFLDKVFFNIFENSVEFIFKDEVIIDIKTEEKNGLCNIHIHDNGIGISKEKREDILENLETLSKRTGMGLYLTKKILERFNGKFEIKDVKKGTEIVVSIPVINGGSARNVHPQRHHKQMEGTMSHENTNNR
jgi:signal transduction histidine kinase/CheY-like chemotaxis protein